MKRCKDVDWNKELIDACRINNLDNIKEALDNGADIESRSINGFTPLLRAIWYGCIETVKLLIEKGSNVNVVDADGWTALGHAVMGEWYSIVDLLLKAGANVDATIGNGNTVLAWAATKNHSNCCELLLGAGADPKQVLCTSTVYGNNSSVFLFQIIQRRRERYLRAMTAALCIWKRWPALRNVAGIIGEMIWKDWE
jgi:ankyrin repeat protein